MEYYRLHPWTKDINEAREIQIRLRKRFVISRKIKKIKYIGAADVAYEEDDKVFGVVAIFEYPSLKVVEVKTARMKALFPYIPGLLSFREGPCLMKAFQKIKRDPDVILFDAHGIAHPVRMGVATHLGILLDKPTIGCAKSRLAGLYKEPKKERGSYSYLFIDGGVVGAVLRTRDGVKPVFVSPGFKMNIKEAVRIVLECTRRFRIPDPLRFVHTYSVQKSR